MLYSLVIIRKGKYNVLLPQENRLILLLFKCFCNDVSEATFEITGLSFQSVEDKKKISTKKL